MTISNMHAASVDGTIVSTMDRSQAMDRCRRAMVNYAIDQIVAKAIPGDSLRVPGTAQEDMSWFANSDFAR